MCYSILLLSGIQPVSTNRKYLSTLWAKTLSSNARTHSGFFFLGSYRDARNKQGMQEKCSSYLTYHWRCHTTA